jgi:hypothetical protein
MDRVVVVVAVEAVYPGLGCGGWRQWQLEHGLYQGLGLCLSLCATRAVFVNLRWTAHGGGCTGASLVLGKV